MLSIDEDGKALLINRARRALLHHFSFKGPVAVARFSPDGKYIAVGVGRLVQVRDGWERGRGLAASRFPIMKRFRVEGARPTARVATVGVGRLVQGTWSHGACGCFIVYVSCRF